MAWTFPPTVLPGEVISASNFGNIMRDDLLYLLARPSRAVIHVPQVTYTTTSSTFTPIDAAQLSITLNLAGSAVMIGFSGMARSNVGDVRAAFDVEIDGMRYGDATTEGLCQSLPPIGGNMPNHVQFTVLATALTPGSHVFRPVWRVPSAGTAALLAGGVAYFSHPVVFWAAEV